MIDKRHYFWTVTIMRVVPLYFLFSVTAAMFFYPGGNIHDSSQVGYSFTHNFLSDLGNYKSFSGEINFFSSLFFNTGMLTFSLTAISFVFAPTLFKSSDFIYVLAICGSICLFIGAFFFAAVGLTPADIYLETHIFVAMNGPRWMALGGVFYLVVLYRSGAARFFLATMSAFFVFVLAYAVYQLLTRDNAVSTVEKLVTQALLQKAIVTVMLGSMFVMSFAFATQYRKIKSPN